jgi:hypothetical protein
VKSDVARRLRKVALGDLETIVCSQCGQRFAIHSDGVRNAELAEKQVAWLLDLLVWDHIQERKHHGSVPLPDLT